MPWLLPSCNSDLTNPLEDEGVSAMSKAFTREDDSGQEADLPERVISPHPNLVTAEGLVQIDAAIARLSEELSRARDGGDVTAAANAARDLRYWSARRATAQLTEPKPSSQVQFGSRATLKRPDGSTRAYRIVGTDEGDPTRGTLSYASPLAQALMGKEIGDTVVVGAREEEIIGVA
jgi:transcription elongation GreA/GreB family factor